MLTRNGVSFEALPRKIHCQVCMGFGRIQFWQVVRMRSSGPCWLLVSCHLGLFIWQLTLSGPPRKHQYREYDSKTEVKSSCNKIMEVTSHNLCCILLVRNKSLGQSNGHSRGEGYIKAWMPKGHRGGRTCFRSQSSHSLYGELPESWRK